jgi:hypothetical protein
MTYEGGEKENEQVKRDRYPHGDRWLQNHESAEHDEGNYKQD